MAQIQQLYTAARLCFQHSHQPHMVFSAKDEKELRNFIHQSNYMGLASFVDWTHNEIVVANRRKD